MVENYYVVSCEFQKYGLVVLFGKVYEWWEIGNGVVMYKDIQRFLFLV